MNNYCRGQMFYYSGGMPESRVEGISSQRERHRLFTLEELDKIAKLLFSWKYSGLSLDGDPVELLGSSVVENLTLDVYGNGCSYMLLDEHPPSPNFF